MKKIGYKTVYMIGIKGVGMTMLAQFLVSKGIQVSGSDTNETFMTDEVLKKSGIKVKKNFSKNNISAKVDLVVYSTAYNSKTNIEVAQCQKRKLNMLTYASALGQIFNDYQGIAVVGSHGKTTTSAWLGFVLHKAKLNPNVMVGANVSQFKGNILTSKSNILVAEIDEYQNKLKHFNPEIVLLNNIDYDHHDFFKTESSYNQAFADFVKKIPAKGFLVANLDDKNIVRILKEAKLNKVVGYSIDLKVGYYAYDLKLENGQQSFKVKYKNKTLGEFQTKLIGKHNVYNALSVIVTARQMGVSIKDIKKYLFEFKGTQRRLQVLGKFNGAKIIDDYGHHPTEIKTTLQILRQVYKNKKIITVFHPHTFTRTKNLFFDFAKSFSNTDKLIVLDIYGSAREKHGGVSSQQLVTEIKKQQKDIDVSHIATLKECEKYLQKNLTSQNVLILMGAGDVFRIGNNLIKKNG